ncbi:type II toxin-antitoxin system PemK/MazF family toxin [Brevibacillus sp. SAFN-007a]|uniref:type II toxin-antitoxin system PemK/MazF family toxin n=1 Tax=Brevibacillus sp. SAFN-007a TaxID=3436862 RepID=UPI003F7F9D9F
MSRHISKRERVENLLEEIKNLIDRRNVDTAIPLLEWTKDKIVLAHQEAERAKKFNASGKQQGKPRFVKRGTVYYADLGKNIGSEQNGYRPVLVIQSQKANVTSPTVIIVPLTDAFDSNGKPKKVLDTHVLVDHSGLKKKSIIKTEYVRSISKSRLRDPICQLGEDIMNEVEEKLKLSCSKK